MKTLLSLALVLASSLTLLAQERTRRPTGPAPFRVEEKTITQIHAALRARQVTCRGLVQAYLARINAYDQKGPSLNAVVLLNTSALQTADELDARMKSGAAMRPLECIPVVVKDNYETKALRTTAGSQSLAKFIPNRDAFVVRRIREAGAIVLFKSNMAEFAFTPLETVSSISLVTPSIRMRSITRPRARAEAQRRPSRRTLAPSGWEPTPETRSVVHPRTRASSAFAPRWV